MPVKIIGEPIGPVFCVRSSPVILVGRDHTFRAKSGTVKTVCAFGTRDTPLNRATRAQTIIAAHSARTVDFATTVRLMRAVEWKRTLG
jgi:hypothetical protein